MELVGSKKVGLSLFVFSFVRLQLSKLPLGRRARSVQQTTVRSSVAFFLTEVRGIGDMCSESREVEPPPGEQQGWRLRYTPLAPSPRQ